MVRRVLNISLVLKTVKKVQPLMSDIQKSFNETKYKSFFG